MSTCSEPVPVCKLKQVTNPITDPTWRAWLNQPGFSQKNGNHSRYLPQREVRQRTGYKGVEGWKSEREKERTSKPKDEGMVAGIRSTSTTATVFVFELDLTPTMESL